MNRRTTLQGMGAAGATYLVGCGESPNDEVARAPQADPLSRCQPVTTRLYSPPGRAKMAYCRGDLFPDGGERRIFTPLSPFRVASVSKVVTAELARRLDAAGRVGLDVDVAQVLGVDFAHPEHSATPITLRQLLIHQSGIIDPDVYWMAAPGNIRELFVPDMWEPGAVPGQSFRYSNLNYGIAATVMEAVTGQRFDRLVSEYIAEPMSLDIGFNWSGVSARRRTAGFPGMRGSNGDWDVQVDGPETLTQTEPAILKEPGFDLDDYVPGTNGTLFSPQGGLRASLHDLVRIGRNVILPQTRLHEPSWVWDGQDSGAQAELDGSEDGHFVAFGEGLYIYPDDEPFGAPAIGHHGEAYGIYCGLFVMPSTDEVFAYAQLASPPDGAPYMGTDYRPGWPNLSQPAADAIDWFRAQRMESR